MTQHLKYLIPLAALALPACSLDLSTPQNTYKHQEEARANRGPLGPTELPPGLGDDLPPPPSTQPVTPQK